ncbi:hypothetical protein CEQ21_23980 [Niallia circulans]|uniref:Uncharacterized protein n=1 Tax=Niallia circulans TaxID=1397 RepID=A0A553SN92_NIACI|nr:hypothetical protein [Niallia circulans]TRZ38453.1 hypothetical protein CEQ21_23980 [Niallia circulans]
MYIVIILVGILFIASLFSKGTKASKISKSTHASYTPWDLPGNGYHDGGHSHHSNHDCGSSFSSDSGCGGDGGSA